MDAVVGPLGPSLEARSRSEISPTSRPQGKAPQLIRRLPVTSTILNLIKVASV